MTIASARGFTDSEQKGIHQYLKDEDFDLDKIIDNYGSELRDDPYYRLLTNSVRWTPFGRDRSKLN